MRTNSRSLRLLLALLAVFALVAAACGNDDDDDTGDNGNGDTAANGDAPSGGGCDLDEDILEQARGAADDAPDADADDAVDGDDDPATADGSGVRVGMVYDIGGRGDQSFNDAAFEGLTRAADELGVEVRDLEPTEGGENRGELLRLLAEEGYDLVIGVGFAFEDAILEVSADFPETTFAVVDAAPEADNVKGLVFAEEQGSFLVGVAAALASETCEIGFIGGVELPLIQKFEAGFIAGATTVAPDIDIDSRYITQPPDFGGFNDPARGGEIASSMFEGGADVVYHAAGGSGGGLFEAAHSDGSVWAIGVDSDQYLTVGEPQNARILTSMLKRVDVAVYGAILEYVTGDTSGGVTEFDLSVDGVGYSTSGGFVDDNVDVLDGFKALIVNGEITVPSS